MSTPTFNLTWQEASALAIAGTPIRREAWANWLTYTTALWWYCDRSLTPLEVVTASDFEAADMLASDWTTDAIGTTRNVCVLPTPTLPKWQGAPFAPSLSLSVDPVAGTLTALLGSSIPSGMFSFAFYLNGAPAGDATGTSGATTVPVTLPSSGPVFAIVEVTSLLPLPPWTGSATVSFYVVAAINYLIVGGGGSGLPDGFSGDNTGGGGGGGVLDGTSFPLIRGNLYSIQVGAGGDGITPNGGVSSIKIGAGGISPLGGISSLGLIALGGGAGAGNASPATAGASGGGGNGTYTTGGAATMGHPGGAGGPDGGGGGGAGASGKDSTSSTPGAGGDGVASSITGTLTYYGGGGGGGGYPVSPSGPTPGGLGGGGTGGIGIYATGTTPGTPNTGGGGGGCSYGGSGIVILSIPTAQYTGLVTGSPTVTVVGSNTILTFTASGSYQA